jgi:uncharacterized protein (TIGR02996 family)
MTALASTHDLLMAAILAEPEDDAPRLALADCLDEHLGDVRCVMCVGSGQAHYATKGIDYGDPCHYCSGTGRAPNSNAARAEFVRVQCELVEHPRPCLKGGLNPGHPRDCRACTLRRRERELLATHARRWLPGDGTVFAHVQAPFVRVDRVDRGDGNKVQYEFRRGFVAQVACDLRTFLGGPCRAVGPHHGDPCRGGRIQSPNAQFTQDCRRCKGTGRTTGIAAGLATQPVTRVVLTDREPSDYTPAGDWYGWWCSEEPGPPDNLPEELWDRLPGATQVGLWKMHESEDAAVAALALAAANHVRSLAPTTHRAACPRCEGKGTLIGDPGCGSCQGDGRVADPDSEYVDGTMDCPDCDRIDCPDCDGGWVTRRGLPPLGAGRAYRPVGSGSDAFLYPRALATLSTSRAVG